MYFNFLAISLLLSPSVTYAQEEESTRLRRRDYVIPSNPTVDEEPTKRVFVEYKVNKRSNLQAELKKRSSRTKMHFDFQDLRAFVLTVPESDLNDLRNDPNVESVHNDEKRYPMYIPESVKYRNLEDSEGQRVPYGIDMVQAQQAWNIGATGQGVKVCVVDTGVSPHSDLSNVSGPPEQEEDDNELKFDQDGTGHGTHCAGTISADNNDFGVVGVAPDAEIISVKVFSDDGSYAYSSGILSAAQRCAELGANVISMSLGGPLPNIFEVFGFRTLLNQGIISVAAAGNFGNGLWSFPASYSGVVSVAAVDENKEKASFSQFNRQVDIAAPGVDVLSTLPLPENGDCSICESIGSYTYGSISGTSMACPHVAGVFALLLSKYDVTTSEYIAAIEKSAEDLGQPGKDREYGNGLIQAYAALQYLNNTSSRSNPPINQPQEAISCDDNEMLFDFKMVTDNHGSDTSWDLRGQTDDGMHLTGAEYISNDSVRVKSCIPKNCYIFTINDDAGDGICCSNGKGAYSLFIDDEILVNGGGDFGSQDMVSFGECSKS